MGTMVTVSQAAYLVRKNERAVRWQIGKGRLTPQEGEDGHTRLDVDELATVRGWRVDPARLTELISEERRTAQAIADRVSALERRLDRMEKLLLRATGLDARQATRSEGAEMPVSDYAAMATHVNMASDAERLLAASGDVSRATDSLYQPRRAVPTMRLGSSLPDDLVSVTAFAAQHGIAETTAKKAAQSGRVPAIQGRWKHGRAYVTWALDADGRRTFYALYGDRSDFQRCADCPH